MKKNKQLTKHFINKKREEKAKKRRTLFSKYKFEYNRRILDSNEDRFYKWRQQLI